LPAVLSSAFGSFAPRSPEGFCFLTSLETSVPRHTKTSTLLTLLDSRIVAWSSVSDFDTYVGFRCSKKAEKHWGTEWSTDDDKRVFFNVVLSPKTARTCNKLRNIITVKLHTTGSQCDETFVVKTQNSCKNRQTVRSSVCYYYYYYQQVFKYFRLAGIWSGI